MLHTHAHSAAQWGDVQRSLDWLHAEVAQDELAWKEHASNIVAKRYMGKSARREAGLALTVPQRALGQHGVRQRLRAGLARAL